MVRAIKSENMEIYYYSYRLLCALIDWKLDEHCRYIPCRNTPNCAYTV